jgi:D-alanyl-D-alanine carboxypeptidase
MNESARELGLTHTSFSNPTGLDVNVEAQEAGAYGSAHDVALLAADFLKKYPEFFNATVVPKTTLTVSGKAVEAVPTALPILDIPGLIGAKTGYTDLAGGNLVAAFDIDIAHPVIAVVLGSSYEGRFADIRTLIEATRAALKDQ